MRNLYSVPNSNVKKIKIVYTIGIHPGYIKLLGSLLKALENPEPGANIGL